MRIAIADKWLPDLSPDEQIRVVAVRTLRSRLDAVQQYLPLAAQKADEDVEYVHQLRVWVRRACAALTLYEEMIPRRRFSWLKKQLKRIRRAANNARDCDVLIHRLKQKLPSRGTSRWLAAVLAERVEAQRAVVSAHDRLRHGGRFARRIHKLLERVASRGEERAMQMPRFREWARERLHAAVERFFAAIPTDPTDAATLHRFRIQGKELRYVIELLAAAFPDRLRTELYAVIEAIQNRLGEINDLATAQARLRDKIERANKHEDAKDWRHLFSSEQIQYERACQKFWRWCTAGVLEKLRAGFEATLDVQRHESSLPSNRRANGALKAGSQ